MHASCTGLARVASGERGGGGGKTRRTHVDAAYASKAAAGDRMTVSAS